MVDWEVVFTGLTDYPYLNGEPGYVAAYGHGLVQVRIDSARATLEEGCPVMLRCGFENLIAVKKGDPISTRRKGSA